MYFNLFIIFMLAIKSENINVKYIKLDALKQVIGIMNKVHICYYSYYYYYRAMQCA